MKTSPQYTPEKLYPTGRYPFRGEHLRVLARDESSYVPPLQDSAARQALDAIIVPTGRAYKHTKRNLARIMQLAWEHQTGVVVFLCSNEVTREEVAQLALHYPGQRWLALDEPFYEVHEPLRFATRRSTIAQRKGVDLADKRNFGLQLARTLGWRTVFFLDDDVEITAVHLDKAAHLLNSDAQVVGFNVREFPDHSAAIHASQLVNHRIDSFLGGGVLAVKTTADFMPFFPHAYNDDWLFSVVHSLFSDDSLVWAGTARQKPYQPYRSPRRAEYEEPGDLLAEGLFRLVMSIKSDEKRPKSGEKLLQLLADKADQTFWEKEINNRIDFIRATQEKVEAKRLLKNRGKIIASLRRSIEVISGHQGIGSLQAKDFAAWVEDWTSDLQSWNKHLTALTPTTDVEAGLKWLGYAGQYTISPDFWAHETPPVAAAPEPNRRQAHPLHGYLALTGPEYLEDSMLGYSSTRYLEEYLRSKRLSIAHVSRNADRLRHDRPLFDDGTKPYMTVAMLVQYGESVEGIRSSLQSIIKQAQEAAPTQLLLWVYSGAGVGKRQLDRYRNTVTAQLVADMQDTTMRLRSSLLHKAGGNLDSVIDTALIDTLFAYWKGGIRLDHYFVVVNSNNQPLRHGTREQFLRHEHGIADKPLNAYLQQPKLVKQHYPPYKDAAELSVARRRLQERPSVLRTVRKLVSDMVTELTLRNSIWRSGATWPVLDDLAHTIEFHNSGGWSSVRDVKTILCVQVGFKEVLPSDTYAIVREIGAAIETELGQLRQRAECMVVVTGEPQHTWAQLQEFRQALITSLVQSPGQDIILTSFIYRRTATTSHEKSRRTIRALSRYIHWLENHRIRPRFSWRRIGN